MAEWVQGGYSGIYYLGEKGTKDYGGYVLRADGETNPEVWFAYEWDASKEAHAWVGRATTAEDAQKAVKGKFLCEVWRNKETGHCPYPGVVVRTLLYRGEQLRMVLCGEHSHVMKGWETLRLEDYRSKYGLIPNVGIYGGRITPPLDLPPIREAVLNAPTITERNMWIALNRVVRPLAEMHYWWGHFARFPLDVNERSYRDARGQWNRVQEQAAGMYAVYMREEHGKRNATLPNELLRLIEREAVAYLKGKKGGK
ncbi:hypothetical protein AB0M00_31415 [Streptomyces chartreusis]|uniref:hypothetical protein n=1 Tax=Streptomyces chartreusis TaxID=1969 RepID=UPI003412CFA7